MKIMGLLEDCEKYFLTKDLYEILGVEKSSSESEITKAYRKTSLKVHPDRVHDEDKKEEATKRFQVLAKVHYTLTNKELRGVYDETGTVLDEEDSETWGDRDWSDYWRLLFPKITEEDIDSFLNKYQGSEEQREDLKKLYLSFEGDMNKIFECHIGYDEDEVKSTLQEMIEAGEVPAFDMFIKEPKHSQLKRKNIIARERKLAEKEAKKRKSEADTSNSLVSLISGRQEARKGSFDNLIANLEAKYGGGGSSGSGKSRKRSKK